MSLSSMTDRVTDSVAVAAVASPVWLPALQQVSEVAALLLPIGGLVWLVIQAFFFIRNQRRK